MKQIFGVHCINGLPNIYTDQQDNTIYSTQDNPTQYDPTQDIYDMHNMKLIENLSENITNIRTQSTSSVYIVSDVSGAQVFIDGVEQTGCNTPSMINNIPSGYHSFKLKHPEHIDTESEISLDPGKTYNMFLSMPKIYQNSVSIDSSDIFVLLTLGLIGYFLITRRD